MSRSTLPRRAFLRATGAATLLAATPFVRAQGNLHKLKFNLGWKVEATAAGFLLAQQRGYYRDAGLDVAIDTGNGSAAAISLVGRLAPGPNYKLYLAPEFLETEAHFHRLKPRMVQVGDVRTFENFLVPVPQGIDPSRFNTVLIWCEAFSQFITAAQYR